METYIHALKENIEILRKNFDKAVKDENISIDRHHEITEACENKIQTLGYNTELLYMDEERFNLTFSTAEKRPEVLNNYKLT